MTLTTYINFINLQYVFSVTSHCQEVVLIEFYEHVGPVGIVCFHTYLKVVYQYCYGGWRDEHGFVIMCILSFLMIQCDSNYPTVSKNVRFEVLTVVLVKIQAFWRVTLCR
jgi:hypothetical protein